MSSEKALITAGELAEMLGTTKRVASKIIADTNKAILQAGGYVINTRPPMAPRSKVYELLGIEREERQ